MLQSDQDADDALQEAFVRLWLRRDSLASESQAEGAAVATVRNICIDQIRRRNTRPQVSADESLSETPVDDSETEIRAKVDEVSLLIESELSERDRRILLMRDRCGYDFDEIAAEFSMTEAAVRVALSRARKTIRNIYRTRYEQ